MKKQCPLTFNNILFVSYCKQDECEWWSKEDNCCIVHAIQKILKEIKAS